MSTINKKPFLKYVLESMSPSEISTLSELMDGNGVQTPIFRTMNLPSGNRTNITVSDKGVHLCDLEIGFTLFKGYLVYTDDYCALFHFTDSTVMGMFDIDTVSLKKYATVSESLTVVEFRSEVNDFGGGGGGGGSLPEATKEGQVIVSNAQNEAEWQDAAPMAENLTPNPINNDALYSRGPTGGLADISTGQEAYLNEVKGYTIIWNQLFDSSNITLQNTHVYIYYDNSNFSLYKNSTTTLNYYNGRKLFDLTLMFGSNDRIPFSLDFYTEYEANGTIPAQYYKAVYGFLRLFSNVDLLNAPYDAGTPKNVSATKLTETGRNLWNENDPDMVENGLTLIPGYHYEIYLSSGYNVKTSTDGGQTWSNFTNLQRYQRLDGKFIWTFYYMDSNTASTAQYLGLLKIKPYSTSNAIKYVGFVHSGNYCLTTGTNPSQSYAITDAPIPAYTKYEFDINGINGLNGVTLSDGTIVADTKDYTRVGHIADLSTLTWTQDVDDYRATIPGIKPSTTGLLASKYINSDMSVDSNGVIVIQSSGGSPTGELFYELETPVATGNDPFEPIPLKSGNNWVVNDMGSEYFTQPTNANCPVNQASLYYENLKDKLVNLKIPEFTPIPWVNSQTPLSAIKVGEMKYNLVPQGRLNNYNGLISNGIALGASSQIGSGSATYSNAFAVNNTCNANNSVAILGQCSIQNSNGGGVVIGAGAYVSNAVGAIAIGRGSTNVITDSVCFDGYATTTTTNGGQRTLQLYDPTKVFFRNEVVSSGNTTFARYTAGHYLSEYIQNNELVNDLGGSNVTVTTYWYLEYTDANNYKTLTKNVVSGTATTIDKKINGLHITITLDKSAWHSVVGLDLLPFDTVNNLPYISYGRILFGSPSIGGSIVDIYAYIDLDGKVTIDCPQLDIESANMTVKFNLK